MAHLTSDLLEFIAGWLPPPPARVLEVGCGEGALTGRLAERGYEVLGLDPDAPDKEGFTRSTLEEFEPRAAFDAGVAVRSLHHLHDADRALYNLRDALVPRGRLVLFEFAIENVDAASERWLTAQGIPHPVTETDHHDVLPLGRLRVQLDRRFRPLVAEPAPYLAREAGREDLVAAEEQAIRAGEIQPAGMRLVLERR
jgi:SAM-dependent methyltransferase